MKKVFKYLIVGFCISFVVLSNSIVFANNGVQGDTDTTEYKKPNECGGSDFCYSGQGLRFSLYKNESNKKSTKLSSFDVWYTAYPTPYKEEKRFTSSNIHYTSPDRDNVKDKLNNYVVKATDFNLNYKQYKNSGFMDYKNLGEKIIKQYAKNGEELANVHESWVYDTFKTHENINYYFGTSFKSSDNLTNYFITVEQVYKLAKNGGTYGNKEGFKAGHYYVGTSYELSSMDRTEGCGSWGNNSMLVYTRKSNDKDKQDFHDFLKNKVGLIAVEIQLTPGYDKTKGCEDDKWVTDNLATPATVGMAVYRLVDIMPKPTGCKETCSGNSGDNLLYCAEKFCSKNEKDNKTSCINACGITKPSFSACSSVSACGNSTTTDCSSKISGSQNSCYPASTGEATAGKPSSTTYYKMSCTESSSVLYNDSLPKTIIRGTGFGYTLSVEGKKECTYTFDYDRWRYDYTMANDENKNKLQGILDVFKNGNLNTEKAKYDAGDIDVEIEIRENVNGKNETVTKKMILSNVPTPSVSKNKSDETNDFKAYVNGVEKWFVIPRNYKTVSTVTASYTLPGVCVTRTGEIYDAKNNTCEGNISPKYEYYTSNFSDVGKNNVVVKIKKPSSCINDVNSCYYNVSVQKSASCNIVKKENNEYVLSTTTTGIREYTYGLSLTKEDINNKDSIIVEPSSKETIMVYGTVANEDGSEIYTSCSFEIEPEPVLPPPHVDEEVATCEIRNTTQKETFELDIDTNVKDYSYGLSTIKFDINNFKTYQVPLSREQKTILYGTVQNSKGEIIALCEKVVDENVIPPIDESKTTTCKLLYLPTDYNAIRTYCDSNWNLDAEEYISPDDCYNDCTYYIGDDTEDDDGPDLNACKVAIVDRTDPNQVRNYCSLNYITDGYESLSSCIENCATTASGLNYVYRPISLKDPFPNERDAGINWFGKEHYITEDLNNPALSSDGKAEYVIKLTSQAMQEIRNQTNAYNNMGNRKDAYVDYVKSDTISSGNIYYSKFINDNDKPNGGFSKYFTVIRSEEVN